MIRQFHIQNRSSRRRAAISVCPLNPTERILPGSYTVILYAVADANKRASAPLLLDTTANSGTAQFSDAPWLPGEQIAGNIYTDGNVAVARISAFTFSGVQSVAYTSIFEPDVFPKTLSFMAQGGSSTVGVGTNVSQWMIQPFSGVWLSYRDTTVASNALQDSTWYTLRQFNTNAVANPFTTDRSTSFTLQCRNTYGKEVLVSVRVTQNKKGLAPPIKPTDPSEPLP